MPARVSMACLALAGGALASAQAPAPRQTEADDYTRYELLAPESARFRILYEVSATTPGTSHCGPGRSRDVKSKADK